MKTLSDQFLDELMDMYDAEHRMINVLPKLADAGSCPRVQVALQLQFA